ncbi:uncharacterized protein LOC119986620 isoform X2 [Tripterygium wilfordii]|uniref:uncharacterized protein LOC119986620 isoform X2 n=1 Tax=Tripterygium wilfordii TaxID=458696 RepID=UPI0018F7ECFB|nr:uncharacterized protein LOC119986620 isoform X2 [Tripterygium wilfordii]
MYSLLQNQEARRKSGCFDCKATSWPSRSKTYATITSSICDNQRNCVTQTNIEIIVAEGDAHGGRIVALVREIDASMLVVGLHEHSFLYRLALTHDNIADSFSCKVLAIKPPITSSLRSRSCSSATMLTTQGSSTNMDFSLIEIARLEIPEIPPPKIPYRICPSPYAIIWRSKKSRRKGRSSI